MVQIVAKFSELAKLALHLRGEGYVKSPLTIGDVDHVVRLQYKNVCFIC